MEAELAAARREIARLQERVRRLEQVIQRVQAACQQARDEFGQVLAQKSGVPPGNWAYARGGYTVATRIQAMLR